MREPLEAIGPLEPAYMPARPHEVSPHHPYRPAPYRLGMLTAELWATRSTCPKKKVGACLLDSMGRVVSTGYNGAASGAAHCAEVGCLLNEQADCVRSIHAEANALLWADQSNLDGYILCLTHHPCDRCATLIAATGLASVYAIEDRPDDGTRRRAQEVLQEAKVDLYMPRGGRIGAR